MHANPPGTYILALRYFLSLDAQMHKRSCWPGRSMRICKVESSAGPQATLHIADHCGDMLLEDWSSGFVDGELAHWSGSRSTSPPSHFQHHYSLISFHGDATRHWNCHDFKVACRSICCCCEQRWLGAALR